MKVISLQQARDARNLLKGEAEYEKTIQSMDKVTLLQEMMKFQQERSASPALTLSMILRGQILFHTLETQAETKELRQLARSYARHLKCELDSLQGATQQN